MLEILNHTKHRPWELPSGDWQYYQEWNQVLFLHWQVPFADLRKLVPESLKLDSFEGKYYVSLVAFTMNHLRPRFLPELSFVSNFFEINVRTYLTCNGKSGVYFLNIEASNWLSVVLAKFLSGLPYEKANIQKSQDHYKSYNSRKGFSLDATYTKSKFLEKNQKTKLDLWLTERYCLYVEQENRINRYEIHHKEWEVYEVQMKNLELEYSLGGIHLLRNDIEKMHYSPGVQVLSWNKETL